MISWRPAWLCEEIFWFDCRERGVGGPFVGIEVEGRGSMSCRSRNASETGVVVVVGMLWSNGNLVVWAFSEYLGTNQVL